MFFLRLSVLETYAIRRSRFAFFLVCRKMDLGRAKMGVIKWVFSAILAAESGHFRTHRLKPWKICKYLSIIELMKDFLHVIGENRPPSLPT